jgi:DNA-binding NarL/FixJ family response regulator
VKRKATKSRSRKWPNVKSDPHVHFLQRKLAQPLGSRELQVLTALVEGKTAREIQAHLKIGAKTVNTYVERLKRKLDTLGCCS